jgi:hypothetical protein
MRKLSLQIAIPTALAASFLALAVSGALYPVSAQAPSDTPAPPAGATPFVTVGEEGVNVRTGPSSVIYPIFAHMNPGETAPAVAVSPHHEWIEIEYNGVQGWVYTAWVTLSPGFLPEVEPPPTPTPPATATIDPTLAAAFSAAPTETRLPTFTPAPPLVVPTFTDGSSSGLHFPLGMTIGGIVLLGALALGVSFFTRR